MEADHSVRLAMLAFAPAFLAGEVPIIWQDEGCVAFRQGRESGVGRLGGAEGFPIDVRLGLEDNLEDVRSLELEIDVVLQII